MNGEGFAFFRWHCIEWPWVSQCLEGQRSFCVEIWDSQQRKTT